MALKMKNYSLIDQLFAGSDSGAIFTIIAYRTQVT